MKHLNALLPAQHLVVEINSGFFLQLTQFRCSSANEAEVDRRFKGFRGPGSSIDLQSCLTHD